MFEKTNSKIKHLFHISTAKKTDISGNSMTGLEI